MKCDGQMRLAVGVLVLAVTASAACGRPQPLPAAPAPIPGERQVGTDGSGAPGMIVRDISFVVAMSYPMRVLVRLRLHLPDTCTGIDRVTQWRQGHLVTIEITTRRSGDACAEVLRTVDRDVWLDGAFESGAYTVRVNGIERQLVI